MTKTTVNVRKKMKSYKSAIPLIILVPASLVLFLSFDYSGDYAINDDWGYSTPIRWWATERHFSLTHWQSMPLITQLALGVGWVELFGFSQSALRQLTLSLALVSCTAVFVCARCLEVKPTLSIFCALIPLSSPIFVGLSYSFMTDIPAIALVMIASFFFIRSFRESGDIRYYSIGAFFLLLAVLLRQTSIALAFAAIVAEPIAKGFNLRRFSRSIFVLVLAFLAYIFATKIIETYVGLPRAYSAKTDALLSFIRDVLALNLGAFRKTIEALVLAFSQFGFFIIPMLPIFLEILLKKGVKYLLITLFGATFLLISSIVFDTGVMFGGGGDVLTSEGLGPRTINGEASTSIPLMWAITALSHFGFLAAVMSGILTVRGSSRVYKNERATVGSLIFLMLAAIITFAPHTIAYAAVFDRYALLPSVLLALCIVVVIRDVKLSKTSIMASWASVFIGFFLSVALTSDFFRWQDARYELIETLIEDGYAEIDGGFEYNNLAAVLSDRENAVSMLLADPANASVRITRSVSDSDSVIRMQTYTSFFDLWEGNIYAVR